MAFLKTCYSCGSKVEKLFDGICSECVKEQFPPIEQVKPINFKIDNMSGQISYNNIYYDVDKIEEMLPSIVKKNIVINENYVLNDLDIQNFEVKGSKLSFDIEVDCDLK